MASVRTKTGDIFKIHFNEGMFTYARLDSKIRFTFYDCLNEENIALEAIVKRPILFSSFTSYEDAVKQGEWEKVGHLPLDDYPMILPPTFHQNNYNFEECQIIEISSNGDEVWRDATPEECIGLERWAVGSPLHDHKRLIAHYTGQHDIGAHDRHVVLAKIHHPALKNHLFLEDTKADFKPMHHIRIIRTLFMQLCNAIERKKPETLTDFYTMTQYIIRQLIFLPYTWRKDETKKALLTQSIINELHTIAKVYGFENAETALLIQGNNWHEVAADIQPSKRELRARAKKRVKEQNYLASLYGDENYPDALLDKGKQILIDLSDTLKKNKLKKLDDFYTLTHAAIHQFNAWEEELEHGIDTMAREVIASDFEAIALAYGFKDADMEKIIEPRDW